MRSASAWSAAPSPARGSASSRACPIARRPTHLYAEAIENRMEGQDVNRNRLLNAELSHAIASMKL